MQNQILEVIKWYEEQLGRRLTLLKRESIKYQCLLERSRMQDLKELAKYGIRISGLDYGGEENLCDYKQVTNNRRKMHHLPLSRRRRNRK